MPFIFGFYTSKIRPSPVGRNPFPASTLPVSGISEIHFARRLEKKISLIANSSRSSILRAGLKNIDSGSTL